LHLFRNLENTCADSISVTTTATKTEQETTFLKGAA